MLKEKRYIFMLEDDDDDRNLVVTALKELGINNNDLDIDIEVQYFSTSHQLMQALRTSPMPSLILIDYNSTPDNGLAVLKSIKADASYNEIPVVILSENDLDQYKKECYANGASSFIRKPDNVKDTSKKIETFFKYWFEVVEV